MKTLDRRHPAGIKQTLFLCLLLGSFATHLPAQDLGAWRPEAWLLDHDTSLTVRCSYWSISGYASPNYHELPLGNGMVRQWSSPDGRFRRHDCPRYNARAQQVFLARLETLNSPDIYRYPLSHEAEKIVYNFELITGIRNSGDGDLVGWCYISHQSRNEWKVWFNKNKDKLQYCVQNRVLYVEELPVSKPKKQ